MTNNLKIFSVFLVLFLIVLSISLISAIDDIGGGFKMNGGQTRTIDVHSICKIVYNEVARDVFVPTKTVGEWQSFIDNLPYGVVLYVCPYCGDGSCNGGETCSSCATDCGSCYVPPPYVPPGGNGDAGEDGPSPGDDGGIGAEGLTCFVAGTKVTMADGSLKNIEDVNIGEKVRGRNGVINTVMEYERPIVGSRSTYIINGKIEFTGDHPFLTKEGKWKVADVWLYYKFPRGSDINPTKLKVGDILVTKNGEEEVISLEELRTRPSEEVIYDLKLDGDNTYIANGFVVHNCATGVEGGDVCFMPGTPISMADGTYKPIEDIKMRDLVKVYDEKTHQIENAQVKQIQTIYHNNVHELHLSNGKVLKPTANHPFLVKGKGWATISGLDELNIGAGKLEIGDYIYSLNSKGNLEEVEAVDIVPVKGNYLTYNFIDMKYGTFLADDIVVHNSAEGIGNGGGNGGKVICTETHRLGYMSDELYNADKEHAEKYFYNDVAVGVGYHSWAKPFVRSIKGNIEFVKKGVPIAVEWSKHAAYEMGVINEDSEIGKVLLETGIPLSRELGDMMVKDGNKDYEFDENLVKGLAYEYFSDILEMDGKQLEENIKVFYQELEDEYLNNKDSYKNEENFQVWF